MAGLGILNQSIRPAVFAIRPFDSPENPTQALLRETLAPLPGTTPVDGHQEVRRRIVRRKVGRCARPDAGARVAQRLAFSTRCHGGPAGAADDEQQQGAPWVELPSANSVISARSGQTTLRGISRDLA